MSSDSIGQYLCYAIVLIAGILSAVTTASKRALDYADRNEIKELLEDNPDSKPLMSIIDFQKKPSKYHYADHIMIVLMLLVAFTAFNYSLFLVFKNINFVATIVLNILFLMSHILDFKNSFIGLHFLSLQFAKLWPIYFFQFLARRKM